MSGLAARFLARDGEGVWRGAARFWRDRALRLFGQYYFWLVVAAFVVFGARRPWLMQAGPVDWIGWACNITVFPLSLYMYIPSLNRMMLLPQAWSLSTELGFYALFPFIWRSRAFGWLIALGGFAVFALATAGILEPDWYGYRLLPGTLPFFLMGRALFLRDRWMVRALFVLFAADLGFMWGQGRIGTSYDRELFLAALAGPVLVAWAAGARSHWLDYYAGAASYGTYLSHIAVLSLLAGRIANPGLLQLAVAGCAVLLGLAGYAVVEVPLRRVRRRLARQG